MKKTVFPLIYTFVVMLTFVITSLGQKSNIAFNSAISGNHFVSPFYNRGFEETKAGNFNIKAVRDFVKTFKTVSSNKWFLAADGSSTSTFSSKGIETTVAYNRYGIRQYIIRIYKENNLLFDIRDMVKSQYYDATITLVKEVETDKDLIFFVHLHDKDSWKIVRVVDGEMKLVENLAKS